MIYRKVEKIDEELSVIGLGCWGLSGKSVWENSDDNSSIEVVHTALDKGINFFDVAPVYGFGHAEEILGKALEGGKRQDVVIASKCGLRWDNDGNIRNDLSTASILEEIDMSLSRLQTDYIDIYQLHWPDPNTTIEETIETIKDIKKSGKIRYLGVTNFSSKDTYEIMEIIDVASQQGLYNMLERNPKSYHDIPLDYRAEDEMIPMCKKEGQAFLPYSPLFQGLLSGKFKANGNFSSKDIRSANPKLNGDVFKKYYDAVLDLTKVADKIDKPLNEVAINWLVCNENVTSIIGGATCAEHLNKNVNALTWELSGEALDDINIILDNFIDE